MRKEQRELQEKKRDELVRTLEYIPKSLHSQAHSYIEEILFMSFSLQQMKKKALKPSLPIADYDKIMKSYLDLSNRYKQYLIELKNLYPDEVDEADPLSDFIREGA